MFRRLHNRLGHYALMAAVAGTLFFINLGAPSLWDIDEGHNAEAAREMLESGNWVVPTFNFQLRVDKPALLYWLQIGAYRLCGINEFAARLPSALASLVSIIAIYEWGTFAFGSLTGLLAALILASTPVFCAAGHFANPDALLNACTILTFFCFWQGLARAHTIAWIPAGIFTGLAVLAKGPVGIVLPAVVIGGYLLTTKRWRFLFNRHFLMAMISFLLVALPWYIWVGSETKQDFHKGFFLTHNLGRFLSPMEGHRGPWFYYLACVLVGFAPWSVFIGPALWSSWRRQGDAFWGHVFVKPNLVFFLSWWMGVYLVFFSFSATKLPNYILPVYPALALWMAFFLERWRSGRLSHPSWQMKVALLALAGIGIAIAAGLLLLGGRIPAMFLRGRFLPGLEYGALLGVVPIAGAAVAWWCMQRQWRSGFVISVCAAAFLLTGGIAGWGSVAVDQYKAPRALVQAAGAGQTDHEARVACYGYYQPSLVFYCRREVTRLRDVQELRDFLKYPFPVYIFLPAADWDELKNQSPRCTLLSRHLDLYQHREVVVISNRQSPYAAVR